MPPNKAPGLDGLPLDFYKTFEDLLSPLLFNVYKEAFELGALPKSMHSALITLIYKKEKDALDQSGYRPISLLNGNQKILAKVLACRLKMVIGTIIHQDQSGFIPNRYGSDNIRRLVNLQHCVYDSTNPTIALSLDAAKAFDCVEWDYLYKALAKFGFGDNFITWIRTLYDTPNACILTNGLISELFHLQRSTRQGCPLSPGLFVLALEPLAQKIRNNTDIHGITVGNMHHKLLVYADDMLVFVTKPETSIPVLLDCIEDFTLLSGYRVNWDKSEAMPMSGHCPSSLFNKWKFRWLSKSIKYLGIQITSDFNDMAKMNMGPLLEKIKIDFDRWSKIHLSLWGKINSIRMMIAPVVFYFLTNIPIYIQHLIF